MTGVLTEASIGMIARVDRSINRTIIRFDGLVDRGVGREVGFGGW